MRILKIHIFLMVFLILTSYQTHAASYSEFRTLLSNIKDAVSEDNMVLALDLISDATSMIIELEKRPILDEEALHWDTAQINLNRSEAMQDLDQISFFANESIVKWNEYIEWYRKLNTKQLAIITANPASHRIQKAVRQLGNAYMRRDQIGDYTIRDMFATYSDLPPKYLSSNSMNLWRSWLFRCPSWEPPLDQILRNLKVKFNAGGGNCNEDWADFHGFLEVWIVVQELTDSKKKKYQRWHDDLGYSLGYE